MDKIEFFTFILSASPLLELRGALPYALANGLSLRKAYLLCVVGNILPVPFLFFFFRYFFEKARKIKFLGRLLDWWFARVEKKSKIISTYGFWGLIFFVSIPFPTTGAWTGTFIATLLSFSFKKTFLAVFLGVLLAAALVGLGTLGIIKLWSFS